MIDGCAEPRRHLVTGQTSIGIARPCVLLLVVGLVTGHAVLRRGRIEQSLRAPRDMAASAGQDAVVPQQPEPSAQGRMVGGGAGPGIGDMAGGAVGGVAAPGVLALEVCCVARHAVIGGGRSEERAASVGCMAARAVQGLVVGRESEPTGYGGMIHHGAVPGVDGMAGEAGTNPCAGISPPLVTRRTIFSLSNE